MKLIKQTLFSITIIRALHTDNYFSVEAENMEEALQIAREVIKEDYKEWKISSITVMRPCYRVSTKTITVEV